MALDERARHDLYLRLEEHLGPEAATTLRHLPPTGWADVATKHDLDRLRMATRSDLDQLRTATRSDLDHFAEVMRLEVARSAEEVRGELHKALAEQTRTVLLTAAVANAGAVIAVAGLAFAAARLT